MWKERVEAWYSPFGPHDPRAFLDGQVIETKEIYPDCIAEKAPKTETGIPKILWRTYKDIPSMDTKEHWKRGYNSGVELKGWIQLFMSDDDNRSFVERHYPNLLEFYDHQPYPIQRVDIVRILYLHKYGGLYSDMDKEFLRDVSQFFEAGGDVYLVRSPNVQSVYTNSLMGSRPGADFWEKCIEDMLGDNQPWYSYGKHLVVMNTTGPQMITRVARKGDFKSVISLLPGEAFESCNVCQAHNDGCQASVEKGNYIRQIEGSSWIGWDTRAGLCVYCGWPQIVLIAVVVLVLIAATFL